jgi:glycosyltransferase involved in cell wall biosynthesis
MIVRDEQERLGHCLDSVQGLVDEIVVVDTGSVDGTVALAESYSARMGSFSWCDDWAAARNVSLALATGDWILWLDADDIMPQECHAEIRRLVDEGGNKSYFFVLDDQGHEQVSCLQMRLFPNLPGIEFEMPVHEQVTPSLGRLGLEMIATDIRVVHTGYTSPEVVRAKKERYLGIMERWLVQRPEDYMTGSHVALTYYSSGKLAEAEAAYRYIVEESTCRQDRNWIIYTTALLFLGRTLVKMGEFERAKVEMLRAEEIDPEYILTKLSLAEVNARLVDWPEALRYGRATLAGDGQMTFFPVDYDAVRYGAELICGQAAQALEQWAEAEEAYRRAAGVPVTQRSEALGNLSNMFKVMDRRDEALAVLDEALVIDPDNSCGFWRREIWIGLKRYLRRRSKANLILPWRF